MNCWGSILLTCFFFFLLPRKRLQGKSRNCIGFAQARWYSPSTAGEDCCFELPFVYFTYTRVRNN